MNQVSKISEFKAFLKQPNVEQFIQEQLGKKSSQFATNLVQVVNQNEMLKKAEPSTILNAAIMATLLDLSLNPSLGHAYIVPFNNKQPDGSYKVTATFMPGYKGFKQLAIRSGQFRTIDTKAVYEGQYIEDDTFLGFHFDWKNKTSDTVIGYACRFELLNGFEKTLYMSNENIEAHAKKYSKTYDQKFGNWKQEFEKMAKKTVTKLCLNSGEAPLSIDMQRAITFDHSVIEGIPESNIEDSEVRYPDNEELNSGIELSSGIERRPYITPEQLDKAIQAVAFGEATPEDIEAKYTLTEEQLSQLKTATND